jgi:hypothetical protein
MPVYVVRAGEDGPIKIGHSIYPHARIRDIQISHWEILKLLALFEGSPYTERDLHQHFASRHIRGEWFAFSVFADLRALGLPELPIIEPECGSCALDGWLRERRIGRRDFAFDLGIPTQTLNRWISGAAVPSDHFLAAIGKETKGAITAADFPRKIRTYRGEVVPSVPSPEQGTITEYSHANDVFVCDAT